VWRVLELQLRGVGVEGIGGPAPRSRCGGVLEVQRHSFSPVASLR
jgi:hypothetical protein